MNLYNYILLTTCIQICSSVAPKVKPGFLDNLVPSLDPNDVRFYLFPDKSNPTFHQEIVYGDVSSLKGSGITKGSKLTFCTHGFIDNSTTGGCNQLKNALLKKKNSQVICVDWGKLSASNLIIPRNSLLVYGFYPYVIKATKLVGERISKFLVFLKNQKIVKKYGDIHLIGLSIGAHASGTAGYYLKKRTNGIIGRITGLDPAGPLYDMSLIPSDYKLDKHKANFVDAIHTDAGVFGTTQPSGHVDFFANGGRSADQPACVNFIDTITGCGHALSVDYYERALLGEKLVGCLCVFNMKAPFKQPCAQPKYCERKATLGFQLPKSSFGNYYVTVPLIPPPYVAQDYEPYSMPSGYRTGDQTLN